MWKKFVSVILLFVLLSSYCFAQESWSPILSVETIDQLLDQLDYNLIMQQNLIEKLQTSNEEQQTIINELLNLLKESEESLRKQIALTQNLEYLIEDQAIYQRKSERKINFYRITTGILTTSLITTLVIMSVSN